MADLFKIDILAHGGEVLLIFPDSFKFIHMDPTSALNLAQKIKLQAEALIDENGHKSSNGAVTGA